VVTRVVKKQSPEQIAVKPISYDTEVRQFHTRILRMSLVVEESRAYWEHLKIDIPKERRAVVAFEEHGSGTQLTERI
jgi:hypothetical protein